MLQRLLLLLIIFLTGAAALLALTGIAPGVGGQAIPLFILLLAAVLIGRAVWPGRRATTVTTWVVPNEGASQVSLDLLLGAGDLVVTMDAPEQVLLSGQFTGPVRHKIKDGGGIPLIWVRPQPHFNLRGRRRADWQIALNPAVFWDEIKVVTGAVTACLDLAGMRVRRLEVDAVSTTLTITVPHTGETFVLHAAGGRATLRIPTGTAAEIINEIRLGEVRVAEAHFKPGHRPDEQRWASISPDLANAPLTSRIILRGGLGVVEVVSGEIAQG